MNVAITVRETERERKGGGEGGRRERRERAGLRARYKGREEGETGEVRAHGVGTNIRVSAREGYPAAYYGGKARHRAWRSGITQNCLAARVELTA